VYYIRCIWSDELYQKECRSQLCTLHIQEVGEVLEMIVSGFTSTWKWANLESCMKSTNEYSLKNHFWVQFCTSSPAKKKGPSWTWELNPCNPIASCKVSSKYYTTIVLLGWYPSHLTRLLKKLNSRQCGSIIINLFKNQEPVGRLSKPQLITECFIKTSQWPVLCEYLGRK